MSKYRLNSAFTYCLLTVLFFFANALLFNLTLFYIVGTVFLIVLPMCSREV